MGLLEISSKNGQGKLLHNTQQKMNASKTKMIPNSFSAQKEKVLLLLISQVNNRKHMVKMKFLKINIGVLTVEGS